MMMEKRLGERATVRILCGAMVKIRESNPADREIREWAQGDAKMC